MPASDFRKLSAEERAARELELREQVARLRMRRNARRLDKPNELQEARRELARLLTVGREDATGGPDA